MPAMLAPSRFRAMPPGLVRLAPLKSSCLPIRAWGRSDLAAGADLTKHGAGDREAISQGAADQDVDQVGASHVEIPFDLASIRRTWP